MTHTKLVSAAFVAWLTACILIALPSMASAAASTSGAVNARSAQPAIDAATRLLGPTVARRFEFTVVPRSANEPDQFTIAARNGKIVISGSSPAVILRGLNTYLGQHGMDISWTGRNVSRSAAAYPLPHHVTQVRASVSHRFAFNDTDDGYTGAYRNWTDWQALIDVLALKGINEVFVPVGTEAVYLDTFREFGYTESELLAWIPMPAHQPWWLLQNMSAFPEPISKQLVESRAQLGQRIANRLRELGMTLVFPGYFGTVPPDFAQRNPGARTIAQGGWVGFTRPDWLDPTGPPFDRVAHAFYASSQRRLGGGFMYKMDLLHEGGKAGGVDVAAASKAVERALNKAHPNAIWVLLGWQKNPRPETLAAIDRSRMLIIDGLADRYNDMDRERDWRGTTYAFGSIWNFGGHTTMGANVAEWNRRYWQWKSKPGSALNGIAVLPEASENNPAALDFLTTLRGHLVPLTCPPIGRDLQTAAMALAIPVLALPGKPWGVPPTQWNQANGARRKMACLRRSLSSRPKPPPRGRPSRCVTTLTRLPPHCP